MKRPAEAGLFIHTIAIVHGNPSALRLPGLRWLPASIRRIGRMGRGRRMCRLMIEEGSRRGFVAMRRNVIAPYGLALALCHALDARSPSMREWLAQFCSIESGAKLIIERPKSGQLHEGGEILDKLRDAVLQRWELSTKLFQLPAAMLARRT